MKGVEEMHTREIYLVVAIRLTVITFSESAFLTWKRLVALINL